MGMTIGEKIIARAAKVDQEKQERSIRSKLTA